MRRGSTAAALSHPDAAQRPGSGAARSSSIALACAAEPAGESGGGSGGQLGQPRPTMTMARA